LGPSPPDTSAADASVASIMHTMSWGAEQTPLENSPAAAESEPSVDGGSGDGDAEDGDDNNAEFHQHPQLLQELQARALAQAAAAAGLSTTAAMAALPMLREAGQQMDPAAMSAMPEDEAGEGMQTTADGCQPGDQSFTCSVCRKVFKREMNLIFHMTTHRPRQPQTESSEPTSTQPVKCQDCNKEFATKYQAKKHYLRRHFQGDKPFPCTKCNKKRFVVKEDLTMHMKSCGNVYVCTCGIRLCSLGALKRHCKYFSHEPESYEPKPEPGMPAIHSSMNLPLEWQGAPSFRQSRDEMKDGEGMHPMRMGGAMQHRMDHVGMHGAGQGEDPMNVCSHAAVMRSMMVGQNGQGNQGHDQSMGRVPNWQPELFHQSMPLSLVHALRQSQTEQQSYRLSGMPDQANGLGARLPGYVGYAPQMHHTAAAAALSAAVSAAYTANTPVSSSAFCPTDGNDPLAWSRGAQQESVRPGMHPSDMRDPNHMYRPQESQGATQ